MHFDNQINWQIRIMPSRWFGPMPRLQNWRLTKRRTNRHIFVDASTPRLAEEVTFGCSINAQTNNSGFRSKSKNEDEAVSHYRQKKATLTRIGVSEIGLRITPPITVMHCSKRKSIFNRSPRGGTSTRGRRKRPQIRRQTNAVRILHLSGRKWDIVRLLWNNCRTNAKIKLYWSGSRWKKNRVCFGTETAV